MSGGSYDYFYCKLEEINVTHRSDNPRRKAFQKLLEKVARAMHDIEWVDSCDFCPGDENAAIDACFKVMKDDPIIIAKAEAFDQMKKLAESFNKELHHSEGKGG